LKLPGFKVICGTLNDFRKLLEKEIFVVENFATMIFDDIEF